jgi:hypothetical protein
VNSGDSLHSRASRVAASAPARLVVIAEGNLGPPGEVGDLILVNGDVSINEGVSLSAAKPPFVRFWQSGLYQ